MKLLTYLRLVLLLIACAVMIEGTTWGLWMMNQPSDLVVLGGVLLISFTLFVFAVTLSFLFKESKS